MISGISLRSEQFHLYLYLYLYLPEAQQQNEVVMGVLAEAAEGYAKGDYFVVVDGIVGPWFIDLFGKLGLPLHYIVLRPALDTAIERCRRRGGDTLAASALSMLEEFEKYVIRRLGTARTTRPPFSRTGQRSFSAGYNCLNYPGRV